MEREQEELLDELLVIQELTGENPCRMNKSIIKGLTVAIKTLIGSHIGDGASREQTAKYLRRSVRTLEDWSKKYKDFPKPRRDGQRAIYYDWVELAHWKVKHKELYKESQ